ncbi:MAG TPA: PAS domain S-box protein, partial [Candidatus Hydrogenedentes bacterium]|nr:PAS domain S-box protein [Candidatus Hydrogenedentota bacterium]
MKAEAAPASTPRRLGILAAVAGACFVSAWMGQLLGFPEAGAAPLWPAAGISFALVLLLGTRVWPGVFTGLLAAALTGATAMEAGQGANLLVSLTVAIGGALEPLVGAWLLRRLVVSIHFFERSRDVFRFVCVVLLMCMAGCTFEAAGVSLAHAAGGETFRWVWVTSWLAHVTGTLVAAPLVISSRHATGQRWTPARCAELLGLSALTVLTTVFLFGGWWVVRRIIPSMPYLVIPLLLWAVFRFGLREAAASIAFVAVFAVVATVRGVGPFVAGTPSESLLLLQVYIGICAMTGITMATAVAERRRSAAQLQELNETLEQRVIERTADLAAANKDLRVQVNERKRAEAELEIERDHLASVINGSPAIICGIAPTGAITFVNPAAMAVTGRQADELVGQNWWGFFYPGERYLPFTEFVRDFEQGEMQDYEMPYRRPDGHVRTLSWSSLARRGTGGEIEEIIAFGNDITERKAAEEALQRAHAELNEVFNAAVPLCVINTNYAFSRVNEAFCVFFGTNRDEVLGYACHELWPGECCKGPDCCVRQVLQGAEHAERELEVVSDDDGVLSCLVTAVPFRGAHGQLLGVIESFADISERKRFEQERSKILRRLEQSNRELEDFAFVASHDLQEPLRKVMMFGHRLKETLGQTLDERSMDYLDRMQNAAMRMRTLIQNLLAYSRVTSQAKPFEPVDLNAVVTEVLSDLESRILETGGAVEVET